MKIKHKNIIILIFITLIVSLLSCRKVIDVKLPTKDGKIVINSFFNDKEQLTINISNSLHILDTMDIKFLDEAEVNVFENNAFKEKLTNIGYGNFIAKTFTPSKEFTYKVYAKYGDLKQAYSENIIPNPIKIISVDTSTVYVTGTNGMYQGNGGGGSYPQYQLKIKFKDPENIRNYYSLKIYLKNQYYYYKNTSDTKYFDYSTVYFTSNDLVIETFNNGESALFSDDFLNGKEYNLLINIDKYNFSFTDNHVLIELNSVSKDYYLYNKSYSLYQSVKGDPFSEPVQVYNNIVNGYGIFAGYSSDTLGIDLKGEIYYHVEK